MPAAKTQKTNASVKAFLETTGDRSADCAAISRIMAKASGAKAAMWGTAIVGYGAHPIVYADGHLEDWPIVAFSPRKQAITFYGLRAAPNFATHLKRLGRHKVSGGCLHVKRLADIDQAVLTALVTEAVKARKTKITRAR
jgi:hypothetical protein